MRFMMLPVRTLLRLTAAAALTVTTAAVAAPALAAGTASQQDSTWLVAAHQSNLAEIAAGQDAQQNATNDDVKMLGEHLVSDHTTLDRSVTTLAQKYDVSLPDAPNAEQQAALAQVKQKSGEAYDAAWVSSQLTGHLKTKAATEKELSAGEAEDVQAAARTATPVVQRHIDELRSIADDLGLSTPSSVNGGTGGQAATETHRTLGLSLSVLGVALVGGAVLLLRRRTSPAAEAARR
jgi:putative membrane protein